MIYKSASTQRTVFFICALAVGLPIKSNVKYRVKLVRNQKGTPNIVAAKPVAGVVLLLIGNCVAM